MNKYVCQLLPRRFEFRFSALTMAILLAAAFGLTGCGVIAPAHPRSEDLEVARTSCECLEHDRLCESIVLGDGQTVQIKELWRRAFGKEPGRELQMPTRGQEKTSFPTDEIVKQGTAFLLGQLTKAIDRESKKYADQFSAFEAGIRLASISSQKLTQEIFAIDIQRVTSCFPRRPGREPSFRLILGVRIDVEATSDGVRPDGRVLLAPLYVKTNSTPAKVLDHRWWNWMVPLPIPGAYHLVLDPNGSVSTQISFSLSGTLDDGSAHKVEFSLPEFSEDLDKPMPSIVEGDSPDGARSSARRFPRSTLAEIPFRFSRAQATVNPQQPTGKPSAVFSSPTNSISIVANFKQFDTSNAQERFAQAADAVKDKKD